VGQISFDELKAKGVKASLDTLARHRQKDPKFSDPGRWANFCDAGATVEGAGVWGAFVGDDLAAYAVTFIVDDHCSVLYEMSRSDMMSSQPNAALWYTINREMLALPAIGCVSAGPTSILDLPGLEEFKTRLGYRKRPVHFRVALRPRLGGLLLNPVAVSALNLTRRFAPQLDLLRRADGILSIALASR
jgi:hypothetical protein